MNAHTKKLRMLGAVSGMLLIVTVFTLAWLKAPTLRTNVGEREEGRQLRPGQPDEALRFRLLQMRDERGEIPADGMEKARQHTLRMKQIRPERLRAKQEREKKSPRTIQAAGIEPGSWNWLGPGNIGGRIRSIVIHPTNTNNMWVGSVTGGIWRTTNGGASWQPVNDFMANLAVSTMAINPVNPNVMYAGTGEGFVLLDIGNSDSIRGAGVFQSTDGGVTWNQLAATNNTNWFYVNRLAISPNGNTILAATASYTDTNNQFVPGGIWHSVDAGVNWNRVLTGNYQDVDFHPTDSSRAIVGADGSADFSIDGGRCWGGEIWYSQLGRCIGTFQAVNFNPPISNGRVELAYAPSNPNIVYASVNQNMGEIYRSIDGGQDYTRVNTGVNFLGGQGGYDNIIWVNPQDANFVIVGGIDLLRSTDGGVTLTRISDWTNAPTSAHADHHVIVAHPGFNNTSNRKVFFGNDGGIYRADNVANVNETSGWTELNNNLGITQFYGAAGSSNGTIIGGTQDNGTVRYNGGTENWTMPEGGDGGFCAADPTDSNYLYGEYVYLKIYRSTNGGESFSWIFTGITDAGTSANFIAPFILDPNNSNTMLAGGTSLWRSTNVKSSTPTWTAIKGPAFGSSQISAIAVARNDSNFICVGHNDGRVFLSTSASPSWTQINGNPGLPGRFVTRLVIDSTKTPYCIYATLGGFAGNNIFRTTNNGATWVDVTGAGATGLPDVPVRSLAIHPSDSNLLYAGTEIGVFTSEDAGATWDLPQDGPANVSVDELFWVAGNLYAATHGRGVYAASGGIYVDCNNTGIQLGTINFPYRTVASAINITDTIRPWTIWIRGCNYDELLDTTAYPNRKIELRNYGGVATIGSP